MGNSMRLGVLALAPGASLVAVHVIAIIIVTATLALHEPTEDEMLDIDRATGTLATPSAQRSDGGHRHTHHHSPTHSRGWKGPRLQGLKELSPGDPRFRWVLPYGTYRLRRPRAQRGLRYRREHTPGRSGDGFAHL